MIFVSWNEFNQVLKVRILHSPIEGETVAVFGIACRRVIEYSPRRVDFGNTK